jgi:hypothetical protein
MMRIVSMSASFQSIRAGHSPKQAISPELPMKGEMRDGSYLSLDGEILLLKLQKGRRQGTLPGHAH